MAPRHGPRVDFLRMFKVLVANENDHTITYMSGKVANIIAPLVCRIDL
jgi:hypothetical protein